MNNFIIADAGPLIALARIDALFLIQRLFGQVFITNVVHHEIFPPSAVFPNTMSLAKSMSDGWVKVFDQTGEDFNIIPGIDFGEASIIQVACHLRDAGNNVLLVMDDRAGCKHARALGLALIGTAGVIGLAKTKGVITAAKPLLIVSARMIV